MTDPTATNLLRDVENYLSALHGSVARHDNLAANLGCAGCELRDKIREQLTAAVSESAAPSASDGAALRDRIAAALYERERPPRDPHWPDVYAADREVFEEMADSVLAVLPPAADRAAILREAAAAIEAEQAREEATEWAQQDELDPETEAGGAAVRSMAGLLRRLAAETLGEQTPATEEDAQRTGRRDRLRNLLARLERMGLTETERGALRQHVETEIREVDTSRAVAAGNKRHVQLMYAELQQAQAAIERVRALRDPIADALERADYRLDMKRGDLADSIMPVILSALAGTEQRTTEA